MKIEKYIVTLVYETHVRKGAPHTVDGGNHYMNNGQLEEAIRRHYKTGRIERPDHIRYNAGSDLNNESIKSGKATLVNLYLGDTLESVLDSYWKTTHSEIHTWVNTCNGIQTAYIMNRKEFTDFTMEFGSYDVSRKVVRYRTHSSKMEKWLMTRV